MWRRRPQISIIVPFADNGEGRAPAWHWLRHFWRSHFPDAELIVGTDHGLPFSKSVAVNGAAKRARGRIFVIADADAYINPVVIQQCADRIDAALRSRKRLWFMPYDKLYRLSQGYTSKLLKTDPAAPYEIPSPPPPAWLDPNPDPSGGRGCDYGHQYGAMCMVMPRQAFFEVNGFCPRFRGWGSEDASLLRALDTLYCQHEVVRSDIVHLWHVRPGFNWETRKWVGQNWTPANSRLAQRYQAATGEPGWMRALVDEHK
jgi:hypothetical protein